ncbi:MAG: hypothetical protein LH702_01440 [Phormidesmis sp. CAN_BIN44]|nr:hypothetical protein [Phormidesmis sp. CAN_BIN44]
MENYFHKQFDLIQVALAEEKAAPVEVEDADADESQAAYHGFSHLIKPDMLINIYSLLDFWIKKICDYQRSKRALKLDYKDIKGKNDFDSYHKYLTVYADIDLTAVQDSYKQLDSLRMVRNQFIHNGGYVPSDQESKYSSIKGISVSIFLNPIVIEDHYVWVMLEHVKKYLHAAAMA